ncbi:hypothetical protein F544_9420 [Bibersteinia trehalosi USDA-ARS-USMARC-190]|uniref:Uncharacterized protein n=1 Tax=Bibersteinia trehalosi USDA-ARS-USMARC-190 TaxID=1263832 RepID=W0R5X5_BIBTR|nr:hypothetical protein [Bibersteinia trehalosi]AHG86171.1 hypothetical protein F544_9420 [Bibersteinia trehalosi USDA-ARS-USMARC-190]
MKISKLSALAMLLASYLPSLSLNAKTLIVDDFLKYQDTSNMHFDFAKPNTGLTPYESQFYLSLNSNDAYFNFSDDDIYKKMIKIKGKKNV